MAEPSNPQHRRVLTACRARLARLPVARHPALRIQPGQEGYRNYLFGARAGPAVEVSSLFHELAHAAQFGPEVFRHRASEYGFRFKVPQRFIYDRYCTEPKTSQATDRELQTFAYQLHLMQAAGIKRSEKAFFEESARIMRWMHDWYWVPGADEDERAQHCARQVELHYSRLDPKDAVARLEGWLDATARRWMRLKQKPEDFGGYAC